MTTAMRSRSLCAIALIPASAFLMQSRTASAQTPPPDVREPAPSTPALTDDPGSDDVAPPDDPAPDDPASDDVAPPDTHSADAQAADPRPADTSRAPVDGRPPPTNPRGSVDGSGSPSAPAPQGSPAPPPSPVPGRPFRDHALMSPQPSPDPDLAPPSLLPVEATTSTWTRFESRSNYDTLGVSRGRFLEGDAFFYRARLGLRTNPLDLGNGVTGLVQFSPQASGRLGSVGTTTERPLGIYEGYFRFQGERASFDGGRFMMNYGDALVIGNLDWNQPGRAFDGFRARYAFEGAFIDGFVTLTARDGLTPAEGHPTVTEPFLGGDVYFWGLYAGLGPLVAKGLELDVYALGLSNVKTEGLPSADDPTVSLTRGGATEVTLGARVKQKVGALDYRLEAGTQVGTRPITGTTGGSQDVFAYQADGEIGFTLGSRLRLALNGVVASGDDPNTQDAEGWFELFPTGHKFLGLMDIIGPRTNVASGVFKGTAHLTDSLLFLLDAHVFTRLEDGGLGQTGTDKFAGYEVNTQLMQKIGAPGRLRGLYGIFIPNAGYYASGDPAHYVEIEAGIVF